MVIASNTSLIAFSIDISGVRLLQLEVIDDGRIDYSVNEGDVVKISFHLFGF